MVIAERQRLALPAEAFETQQAEAHRQVSAAGAAQAYRAAAAEVQVLEQAHEAAAPSGADLPAQIEWWRALAEAWQAVALAAGRLVDALRAAGELIADAAEARDFAQGRSRSLTVLADTAAVRQEGNDLVLRLAQAWAQPLFDLEAAADAAIAAARRRYDGDRADLAGQQRSWRDAVRGIEAVVSARETGGADASGWRDRERRARAQLTALDAALAVEGAEAQLAVAAGPDRSAASGSGRGRRAAPDRVRAAGAAGHTGIGHCRAAANAGSARPGAATAAGAQRGSGGDPASSGTQTTASGDQPVTDNALDLLLSQMNRLVASNAALVADNAALKAGILENNAQTVREVTAQTTAIERTFKRAEQTHRETLAGGDKDWRAGTLAQWCDRHDRHAGGDRRGRHRDVCHGPGSCHFRADGGSLCDDAGRTGRRRACVLGDAARRRSARGADRHLYRATECRQDIGSVLARVWPPDLLGRAALARPIAGWCRGSGCPFEHARRCLGS